MTAAVLTEDASRLRILDAIKELAKAPFTVQDLSLIHISEPTRPY